MFAASDRSRGLRTICADEKPDVGRSQRLASAQPPGAVKTAEHQPRGEEAALSTTNSCGRN